MADINTVYAGTIDQQDADIVIFRRPKGIVFPWGPTGGYEDIYLPDEIRAKIRKSNADATATIEAVKVAYTGKTTTERIAWLKGRLTAITNRVYYIKARTDELLTRLQGLSTDSYNTFTKIVTSALALVPVVGAVATFAQSQANTAQTLEQYKLQSLIQDYATDLKQLAAIRNQLTSDLADLGSDDPTNEAPTAWPTWYYLVGAGLVLLFFVWYGRRKPKRRKR